MMIADRIKPIAYISRFVNFSPWRHATSVDTPTAAVENNVAAAATGKMNNAYRRRQSPVYLVSA
jgi:hypothetical protein